MYFVHEQDSCTGNSSKFRTVTLKMLKLIDFGAINASYRSAF